MNNMEQIRKNKKRLDFCSLYELLESSNPILVENRMFWTRKGNGQKYTCILCNISIQTSENVHLFKTSILAHLQDKFHKKKFETYKSQEISNTIDKVRCEPSESCVTDEYKILEEIGSLQKKESGSHISRAIKATTEDNVEDVKNDASNKQLSKEIVQLNDELVSFDSIYDNFEKRNPVVKTSKLYLVKHNEGRHYICTLCDMLIFNPLNANEFRYNLWVHLNDDSHRRKLPNFNEVVIKFNKFIKKLKNSIPSNMVNDVVYFEIGPIYRFIKCSLCEVAVSSNPYRVENHIKSQNHEERKNLKFPVGDEKEHLSNHTCDEYRKLVNKIEDQFKKDIKYIQIGRMPGYVICSLCCYVVLPTQFYLQAHFESAIHTKNKSSNLKSQGMDQNEHMPNRRLTFGEYRKLVRARKDHYRLEKHIKNAMLHEESNN